MSMGNPYTPPAPLPGDYYASFGMGQPLRKYHVRLTGFLDEVEARLALCYTFDQKWSMIYNSFDWFKCPPVMVESPEIVIEARYVDLP